MSTAARGLRWSRRAFWKRPARPMLRFCSPLWDGPLGINPKRAVNKDGCVILSPTVLHRGGLPRRRPVSASSLRGSPPAQIALTAPRSPSRTMMCVSRIIESSRDMKDVENNRTIAVEKKKKRKSRICLMAFSSGDTVYLRCVDLLKF